VYFTEAAGNKIGRLNPSTHSITEWTLPTANSGPAYLAVDPNGNVYIAQWGGNRIGAIS
jgi:virginiamycin B lyase